MRKLFPLLLMALLLFGCTAGLEEDYSCTQVGGSPGCVSMDDVRQNIGIYANSTKPDTALPLDLLPNDFTTLPKRSRQGEPSRTNDVVKKVTVFPFINQSGHYVDTTDIYLILDNSRWTGRPVSAIRED